MKMYEREREIQQLQCCCPIYSGVSHCCAELHNEQVPIGMALIKPGDDKEEEEDFDRIFFVCDCSCFCFPPPWVAII